MDPTHLVADSLIFDHHCHLRHDLGGRGPLELDVAVDEAVTRSNLTWLIAGLPQMSPPRLVRALDAPVELELTGAGGGIWTLQRAQEAVEVLPGARDGAARLSSTADEFLLWGTHRINWADSALTLQGDQNLGVEVATTDEVTAASTRLAGLGLNTLEENDTICCYALQDKVWVHGPGIEPWEVYTVKADAPHDTSLRRDTGDAAACGCGTPAAEDGAQLAKCC